jgi:PAS domain S-box-containing protein
MKAAKAPGVGRASAHRPDTLKGGEVHQQNQGTAEPHPAFETPSTEILKAEEGLRVEVAEHKCREEALRESEVNYRSIFDAANDAIFVHDIETGDILDANQKMREMYGYTVDEVRRLKIGDLSVNDPPYTQEDALRHIKRATEGEPQLFQWLAKDKAGRLFWVEVNLKRALINSKDCLLAVVRDINERKRHEAQYMRAQRMESLGTLAGGIAHDINNVLSPILMAIRILQMRFPDQDSQDLLKILQANAERGGNMVRQILEFARGVEGDRMLLEPDRLIKEIARVVGDILPKSIEIRSVASENLWLVNADPTQLHQVLMNLFVNARDAMPHGGTISIEANNKCVDESYARMNLDAKPGCYICIAVVDTGTGIPDEIIDRIFEPFFTTKEQGKGTGLGLSTVLTLVKSHGGFINVYSETGMGTEFRIYLPAAEPAATRQADELIPNLPHGHDELILVVDDEQAIREITRRTLEAYGYRVLTAEDGAEAVALFAQNKDDIRAVLMDMMMPYMEGPASIRAIQRLNPEARIIVSSGLKANRKAIDPTNGGVKLFLAKPYTADKLLNALAEILTAT